MLRPPPGVPRVPKVVVIEPGPPPLLTTSLCVVIKALITTHKEVVSNGGGPGSMTTTFGTRGTPGGGLSMNQKPKVIQYELKNQAVLNALVAITGQNFDFD